MKPARLTAFLALAAVPLAAQQTNSILFVTQVAPDRPHHTVTSIDGSLLADTAAAPRGGDLMILYTDMSVKNLTRAAGYGIAGDQQKGDNAIAVRDPHVHFSGRKALFSMVRGAPGDASDTRSFYWQVYEITGLEPGDTPVITRIPNQAPDYNNVQPAYLSDGRIVFVSDCPITRERHLYPALDENGQGPANTGLWTVEPAGATPQKLMTHAPSGAFEPFVDSYGRIMFTRWDLLQRDKLAVDAANNACDFQSEAAGATFTPGYAEFFPEPLPSPTEPFGLSFDIFLPWTINQDGQELNTLNHLGRHELTPDFPRSGADAGLEDFTSEVPDVPASGTLPVITRATSFLQLSENPTAPGRYIGTDVLATSLSAGRAVSILVPPTMNPDDVTVRLISQAGLVRDASWLTSGFLCGSWVPGPQLQHSHYGGDPALQPVSPDFLPAACFTIRIATGWTRLDRGNTPVAPVTRTITQFVGGQEVTRTANLWQLQPVEVFSRAVPAPMTVPLEPQEASAFISNGVSPAAFRAWLQETNQSVVSSRNVLNRDHADRQQPYSLALPNGLSNTVENVLTRTVDRIQFFMGEYLRAYSAVPGTAPDPGRRITARPMSEAAFASNPPTAGPDGSTQIADDGSMAAILPAGRSVTWQLADPQNNAVVRERYWLSFRAGEIRMCTSCHQVNRESQSGGAGAKNSPEALRTLLAYWKSQYPDSAGAGTSYSTWAEVKLGDAGASTAADGDGDGLTNVEEFIYGTDPKGAASALAQPLAASTSGEATTLRFTQNRDATGSVVIAESSSDMTSWQEAARILDATATTTAPGTTLVEESSAAQSAARVTQWQISIPAPPDSRRQFFRLRFEVP